MQTDVWEQCLRPPSLEIVLFSARLLVISYREQTSAGLLQCDLPRHPANPELLHVSGKGWKGKGVVHF